MYVIIVKAKVKPESVSIYESTFKKLRATVLEKEPGVTFYELCRVPNAPCEYRVVESYPDQATQDEHLNTDYYKAASVIFMNCLVDGAFEMEVVETV